MKAIIVDDEEGGRETLQMLIARHCPGVTVAALAASVEEAHRLILQHAPDVVFLDIEMPGGGGFALLEQFASPQFHVIFITAYEHYAIRALRLHAVDYLLKPVIVEQLIAAVKEVERLQKEAPASFPVNALLTEKRGGPNGRIALPVREGIVYIAISTIVRIESDKGYSTFFTDNGKQYIVSRNLKEYEDLLPPGMFFRIHKSHLVNIGKVRKYLRNDGHFAEMQDGSVVEIARRKKDEFLQLMAGGS